MACVVPTYPQNQWNSVGFWKLVDRNIEQEIRIAAAYDRPVEKQDGILTHAIPAGNA